jgi:hypothetical protein
MIASPFLVTLVASKGTKAPLTSAPKITPANGTIPYLPYTFTFSTPKQPPGESPLKPNSILPSNNHPISNPNT